jgi:hypothetical protein
MVGAVSSTEIVYGFSKINDNFFSGIEHLVDTKPHVVWGVCFGYLLILGTR